jgi:hypothetical protein
MAPGVSAKDDEAGPVSSVRIPIFMVLLVTPGALAALAATLAPAEFREIPPTKIDPIRAVTPMVMRIRTSVFDI